MKAKITFLTFLLGFGLFFVAAIPASHNDWTTAKPIAIFAGVIQIASVLIFAIKNIRG